MRCLITCWLLISLSMQSHAQQLVEHNDYDRWESIKSSHLSDDGHWLLAVVNPQVGDGHALLFHDGEEVLRLERAYDGQFAPGMHGLIVKVKPSHQRVRSLKLKGSKSEDLPHDQLLLVDLRLGLIDSLGPVTSASFQGKHLFSNCECPMDLLAVERPAKTKKHEPPLRIMQITASCKDSVQVLDSLQLLKVDRWDWQADGDQLWAVTIDSASKRQQLHRLSPTGFIPVGQSATSIGQIAISKDGHQMAWTSQNQQGDLPMPAQLWLQSMGQMPQLIAGKDFLGLPRGTGPLLKANLSWHKDSDRLIFGYGKPYLPVRHDSSSTADERAAVDVWAWTDVVIQPQQAKQLWREKSRHMDAVYHIKSGAIQALGNKAMPSVVFNARGNHHWAMRYSQEVYRQQYSWDIQLPYDVELVHDVTGEVMVVGRGLRIPRPPSIAPDGHALAYYDQVNRQWILRAIHAHDLGPIMVMPVKHAVHDERHDSPSLPSAYGSAGWMQDGRFLVYDAFDVIACDPMAKAGKQLTNLTKGFGRQKGQRTRVKNLAFDWPFADNRDSSLSLHAFHHLTKKEALCTWRAADGVVVASMDDAMHGKWSKARQAPVMTFTKEDVSHSPDLWLLDANGESQLTHLNPQQDSMQWPEVKLLSYRALGKQLQGLLYTPKGASDEAASLPVVVYFYERYSDQLHAYKRPAPSASTINISWFVSQGYAVFIPDIVYQVGRPGPSALTCINKGVDAALRADQRLDPLRMGLQGQSWGGYQVAWVITRSDRFVCAMAGAPVSNMFSAYGGIRYASGMSRQFQYEQTQSRLGVTPWEKPNRYTLNSPLFKADKVRTPLLMMHNDNDGAVPYTQGIEYFMALRRLDQPVWLLVYNGESHNLRRRANRMDLSERMGEFFNHYLMDAVMPNWMADGRPITQKPIK